VVWTVLNLPFGALGGFVSVALTFMATRRGLSISEGALLNGAQLLTQWLKWLWAPIVDVTLSPRTWYLIATVASAFGVLAMAAVPLDTATLDILLAIIAGASLINSVVGMSVEAMIAASTAPEQIGRVSAWFQAGNLGGNGLGGGLGLWLAATLPRPWMSGAVVGALFLLCCAALAALPHVGTRAAHPSRGLAGAWRATRQVARELAGLLKTRSGFQAAVLCALPVSTGAAQGVLTQAKIAALWGAGAAQVALVQGAISGLVTTAGCFLGGFLCQRIHPRAVYVAVGLAMSAVAVAMCLSAQTVDTYVGWNLVYSFVLGLAYAAFTALVLDAIGTGAAATKYNVFASLSNFPLWWLGLLLGVAAQRWGARAMLLTEAAFGFAGVTAFLGGVRLFRARVGPPSAV